MLTAARVACSASVTFFPLTISATLRRVTLLASGVLFMISQSFSPPGSMCLCWARYSREEDSVVSAASLSDTPNALSREIGTAPKTAELIFFRYLKK